MINAFIAFLMDNAALAACLMLSLAVLAGSIIYSSRDLARGADKIAKLEQDYQDNRTLKAQVQEMQSQLETYKGEKESLRDLVLSYLSELYDKHDISQHEVEALQAQATRLIEDIESRQQELNQKSSELSEINGKINDLSLKKDNLDHEVEKLKQIESDLEHLKSEDFQESIKKANQELDDLHSQIEERKRSLINLKDDDDFLSFKINSQRERQAQIDKAEKALVQRTLDLENKREDLSEKLRQIRKDEAEYVKFLDYQKAKEDCEGIDYYEVIHESQVKLDKILDEIENKQEILVKLQADESYLNYKLNSQQERQQLLAETEMDLKKKAKDLENQKDQLNEQLQELKNNKLEYERYLEFKNQGLDKGSAEGKGQRKVSTSGTSIESDERFVSLQEVPECLKSKAISKNKPQKEIDSLEEFKAGLEKMALSFSMRTLLAFHTALKVQDITPLTVLAGVSGTGKSILPLKYAEFFNIHCLTMSVQPRWDSPQDLLGFYNFIEGKYVATDLSRLLYQYDKGNYANDLSLVMLDEMNLARTEYYFSEFLSKLEFRRALNQGSDADQAKIALSSELSKKLSISDNILFVGTMNEDESTQTLSDKVLDRANVLRFGCPKFSDVKNESKSLAFDKTYALKKDLWSKWCHPSFNDGRDFINKNINELNSALNSIGKPFGFRVRDAIMRYTASYPRFSDGELSLDYKTALADQIELKILPKLRGLDCSSTITLTSLDKVRGVISETEDEDLINAFSQAYNQCTEMQMFIWQGVSR